MKKGYLLITIIIISILITASLYIAWNTLPPNYTCAQCHEIRSSCSAWQNSVHADITCIQCHGTALSNGFSSLSEKTRMVYTHLTKDVTNEELFLREKQVPDMINRCAECHQAEHAAWQSGAHSTTYRDIFMDKEHNKMEKPYWDCFRCHGMHYDGNIHDLMSLEGEPEEWYIKDEKQADHPTITCLACHQMHGEQEKRVPFSTLSKEEKDVLANKAERPATALYMRSEKRHLPSDEIFQTTMYQNDSIVQVSTDPNAWLCMQCHAPNGRREIKTKDDKTPTGKYAGMSCIECHNPHSNQLKNSYRNVHNN